MVRDDSFWMQRMVGTLEITLSSGRMAEVTIYQEGRSIWINKRPVHPVSSTSMNGILEEIGQAYRDRVIKSEWKTLVHPLKF